MSNSVGPDEMGHYEPSHLDLRFLQKPIMIAYGSERVEELILPGKTTLSKFICLPSLKGSALKGKSRRMDGLRENK